MALFTALLLSASAAVYSILGLTAIFPAAFWSIVILGGSLELGKIVSTLWLHKYWHQAELQYKAYLSFAVLILMVLTSLGTFGWLSKAHLDQAVPTGDVQAKVLILDDKIKTQRDNIDVARKALAQMNAGVDQLLSRTEDERGVTRSAALRRSQAKERTALQNEIDVSQKEIVRLQEERSPIASQVRQVEAEVGPIKYIAAMIYEENPSANVLEKAVRIVIILIIIVFDPLALTLLLAATKTFEWEAARRRKQEENVTVNEPTKTEPPAVIPLPNEPKPTIPEPVAEAPEPIAEPEPAKIVTTPEPIAEDVVETPADEHEESMKEAERAWKAKNPTKTLKEQRTLFANGLIPYLPWDEEAADAFFKPKMRGYGSNFPNDPTLGDTFVCIDRIPYELFKFNGTTWIPVNKDQSTTFAFDKAYIDFLIRKVSSGEYDLDLLSDIEQEQVAAALENSKKVS